MEHHTLARVLLAILCGGQSVVTPLIDLNRTHATNPAWPSHARFHLVWQVAGTVLMSVLEIALIWWSGHWEDQRFYLAAILTSVPLLAFLIALVTRRAYDGALYDPNGIQPARIAVFGRVFRLELNLVAVAAALLVLAAILAVYAD